MDANLLGRVHHCQCGRDHAVLTKRVEIGRHILPELPQWMLQDGLTGDVFLVADERTWEAAGRQVYQILTGAGRNVRYHILRGEELHADSRCIGEVMVAMEPVADVIVAVGTGTINDLSRFCAHRLGIPYLIVATAPSMDGFASSVTPVIRDHFKITYPGIHPTQVIGDLEVLCQSPLPMMAAGFGDILGKRVALVDWTLGQTMTGEFYCPTIAGMMEEALQACLAVAPQLPSRSPEAVGGLMNALALSGIAMQMMGNSRPASGAEHHISHFLEMRDMARGRPSTYHGDKVGVASLLALRVYEKFFAGNPPAQGKVLAGEELVAALQKAYGPAFDGIMQESGSYLNLPSDWEDWKAHVIENWARYQKTAAAFPALRAAGAQALRAAHGPVTPQDMGYSRGDIADAMRYARFIRGGRPTILTVAAQWGCLDGIVEEILDEVF